MRHRLLHHAGAFHHLRQEHFALPEQIAHDIHAIHQRAFDNVQRSPAFGKNLAVHRFRILGNEIGNAMHQRVREAFCHIRIAPFELFRIVLRRTFGVLGDFDQPLTRIGAAVQNHIFHALTQFGFEFRIHADHARIDDAHIQPRRNRVVQKNGMNRLTHRVVAAKRETHVRHAARYFRAG